MITNAQETLFAADVAKLIDIHRNRYNNDPPITWLVQELRGGMRSNGHLTRRWSVGNHMSFYDAGFMPYDDPNHSRTVRVGLEEDHVGEDLTVRTAY